MKNISDKSIITKQFLKFSGCVFTTLTLWGILGILSAAAELATYYNPPRYVGKVWINQVTVEQGVFNHYYPGSAGRNNGGYGCDGCSATQSIIPPTPPRTMPEQGAVLKADFTLPTCPKKYHTEGFVTFQYTNGKAYFSQSYTINRGNEGKRVTPTWQIWGYYGQPSQGKVGIKTSVKCVYHAGIGGILR